MIGVIIGVIVIVALLIVWSRFNIGKNSKCKNCKAKLSYPDDFTLSLGEEKTVVKQKNDGTPYSEQFKTVVFDFHCTKCKKNYTLNREFSVNRSDSAIVRTPEQIEEYLKVRVPKEFEKGVFTKAPEFVKK